MVCVCVRAFSCESACKSACACARALNFLFVCVGIRAASSDVKGTLDSGQMHDLRRLFKGFGSPDNLTSIGDIETTKYVFIGDFVDRGALSLEVCKPIPLNEVSEKM